MKTFISLFALILSLSLTAQTANWYYNPTSGNGIQTNFSNSASGSISIAMGLGTTASGQYSTAMGVETTASGERSTAMGHQTEASGEFSTAMGRETIAGGYASTAMGLETTASGFSSTAMGQRTTASGGTSTAMGYQSTASGSVSTAMGDNTEASGRFSTAMGEQTIASDYNSLAGGRYNLLGSTITTSAEEFSLDNTAFVIGNGTASNNRSDAFVVKFNGDATLAGSMTATSFIGDGSQLTNLPSSGADSPFSYNSNEAGGIEVANYTTASGSRAFAVGNDNSASGSSSTAMGRGTIASGDDSTAMGANTEAGGNYSTALGRGTSSRGETATAIGQFTSATGKFSLSAGLYSNATGTTSVALGNNTIADGYGTLATGYFNTANANPQADSFDQFNTALVIGNGTFENRSNAFEVLFDGTTTIAGDLNVNSDARLKANIISLGSTLSKLLQIDGKSYTMKKDESDKQKIGLLAQDIEKVFPELVSESNGIKSVNYQGLVPVLINALKEQQSEIDELKTMLKTLIEKT